MDAGRRDASVQRAGKRMFSLRDSVWTDVNYKNSMRKVVIRPYSAAYFRILDLLPELRESLALGDKVIVAGKDIAIEIGTAGLDTLTDRQLAEIQSKW
jgi:hypothetical protein